MPFTLWDLGVPISKQTNVYIYIYICVNDMWSWAKIHAPDRSFGSFLMCNIQWLLIERPIPKTEKYLLVSKGGNGKSPINGCLLFNGKIIYSYGRLCVITGYKRVYTLYKCAFLVLITGILGHN